MAALSRCRCLVDRICSAPLPLAERSRVASDPEQSARIRDDPASPRRFRRPIARGTARKATSPSFGLLAQGGLGLPFDHNEPGSSGKPGERLEPTATAFLVGAPPRLSGQGRGLFLAGGVPLSGSRRSSRGRSRASALTCDTRAPVTPNSLPWPPTGGPRRRFA